MNCSEKIKINFVAANVSRISMGVFEVTRQLAKNLINENYDVHVFGLADQFTTEDLSQWEPIQPYSFNPILLRQLGYSKKYLDALLSTPADLAHLHVIWMYQSAMIYKWHKKFKKPYITTLNGMLDPWAVRNSKFKKRIAYQLYEKTAMNACSCFHVNTTKEYESIRLFGLKNPVAIINNGISIPDANKSYKIPPWNGLFRQEKKVLLYLSRVHPKKGLINLIEAMAMIKQSGLPEFDNWVLVIVGCNEKGVHERVLAELVAKNKLERSVFFLGQFFNEDMQACYYHSDAYILPSYSEGVPMAALTAWAFGKFSLLTPECNLTDGYKSGAALKIEANPDSIADGLKVIFTKNEAEIKHLGLKAYDFARKEYSWREMAKRMSEVYKWVSYGGSVPSNVFLK